MVDGWNSTCNKCGWHIFAPWRCFPSGGSSILATAQPAKGLASARGRNPETPLSKTCKRCQNMSLSKWSLCFSVESLVSSACRSESTLKRADIRTNLWLGLSVSLTRPHPGFDCPASSCSAAGLSGTLTGRQTNIWRVERCQKNELFWCFFGNQREKIAPLTKKHHIGVHPLRACFCHPQLANLDQEKDWEIRYQKPIWGRGQGL